MNENQFNYVVSLSYAHEDKRFVKSVARHLKAKGLSVFFDGDDQVKDWGKDLIGHLNSVYGRKSKFCVVFISKHYKVKGWAQFEHRVLQSRALKEESEYILPFRMDNTEIPGFPDSITYLSIKEYGAKRLANAIVEKINEDPNSIVPPVNWQERLRRIFNKTIVRISAASITAVGSFLVFTGKLTPVDSLAVQLYKASRRETQYSKCRDGSITSSVGSGACSHHKGVSYPFDTTVYLKTMRQCRDEATKISWLAPTDK